MKEQYIWLLFRIKLYIFTPDYGWKQQILKWSSVKVCTTPNYEKLKITDLIKLAWTQTGLNSDLSDYEYAKLYNKQ